ncbi:MAG: hypothetical protein R3232_02800 [Clostridia bacterium]|nr:hypothetical protein [Clostridia bacterium]
MKNTCPYCRAKLSIWKKWQLTDNRFGRRCPECNNIIVLPKWFVRLIQFFDIGAVVILIVLANSISINRILFLSTGAVILILLNILVLNFISIRKSE